MRYEPVVDEVYQVLNRVREEHFPELAGANILCVFDTKKKMKDGKIRLAEIKKCSEFVKFLTMEDVGDEEGYDYIIEIYRSVWDLADDDEKVKLIRHELRHTNVDLDKKKPWGLRGHTVEDFYSELRLNRDNPRWAEALMMKVASDDDGSAKEIIEETFKRR